MLMPPFLHSDSIIKRNKHATESDRMIQDNCRRLSNAIAAISSDEGIHHPQWDEQVRTPAEQAPLFLIDQHRHGGLGNRKNTGLPEDAAGISTAVQVDKGPDTVNDVFAVRAVADQRQPVRQERRDSRFGGCGGRIF